jgi:hypothetical protein
MSDWINVMDLVQGVYRVIMEILCLLMAKLRLDKWRNSFDGYYCVGWVYCVIVYIMCYR